MSSHKSPRDVFNGVGEFLKELKIPLSTSTSATPGKIYLSSNSSLAYVDNDSVEHIIADTNTNATHSGDVTGPHSDTVVERIQGVGIDPTAPTDTQALVFDTTSGLWRPTSIGTPHFETAFVSGDWVVSGEEFTLTYPHLLTFTPPVRPQVVLYDQTTGRALISGPVNIEVTPTEVILTSVQRFAGSIALLLPFV